MPLLYYARSCVWLIAPVLLMNLLLARKLPKMYQPEVFSRQIPPWINAGENIFRLAIFVLPLLMRLQLATPEEMIGFLLYLAGLMLYLLSWIMQIAFQYSAWSRSRWGFMAPSYTPLLWLIGVALIGDSLFFPIPCPPCIYIGLAVLFLFFHNLHTWIVYTRATSLAG